MTCEMRAQGNLLFCWISKRSLSWCIINHVRLLTRFMLA